MEIRDVVFVYQMKSMDEIKWHGRYHNHAEHEFEVHYFIQGRGRFLNNGTLYTINPGSLFLTPPGVMHSIRVDDLDDPVSYYAILFYVEPDEETTGLLLEHLPAGKVYRIGTGFRFFFEEIKEKGMSEHVLLKKSAGYQFLSFLYQLSDGLHRFHYGSESNHHIEKALRILQNAIMDKLSLSDLAGRLRLSESYLVRLFRKKLNMTPMKYYRRLKIEVAVSMLISTELPVYIISQKLNFYSEFHFSKTFKQITGYSPTQYREKFFQTLG